MKYNLEYNKSIMLTYPVKHRPAWPYVQFFKFADKNYMF